MPLTFFLAGFRRWSAYRMATAAGAFTNSVFGLIKASITLGAIAAAGGTLAGYDKVQGSTYAWFTQAFLAPVYVFGWNELALRVRSGDIAVDLARPVDLQLSWLFADLGRAAYSLLPRGIPPLLVGALTFGLAVPGGPGPWLLGLVSLTLGVAVSFCCRFALNLSAFWLLDVRGPLTLYVVLSNVLSGLIVPVAWFPGWLGVVADCTPFPSMLMAPVDVVMGRSGIGTVGVQALWLVGTLGLGRVVLARATRKLVVQGG